MDEIFQLKNLAEQSLHVFPRPANLLSETSPPIVPYIKDLNLKDSYADYKDITVKEHIQNWLDQCYTVGKLVSPGFSLVNHQLNTITIDSWTIYLCRLHFQQENSPVIGWIALKYLSDNLLQLEFFNASTALDPNDILVLGYSSKRDAEGLAGYFGEGVKVEINRLLYSGAKITYFSNGCCWNFTYSVRRVLQAEIHPCQLFPFTVMRIHSIPKSAFQSSDFLLLHPCTHFIQSSPIKDDKNNESLSGLQLLFDEHTKGRIYVHGIFVMKFEKKKEQQILFGLNYIGPNVMTSLGMGRDRNDLDVSALSKLIPDVFHELHQQLTQLTTTPSYHTCQAIFNDALTKYYESLVIIESNYSNFAPSNLDSSRNSMIQLADFLVQIFFQKNSISAIPFLNPTPHDDEIASIFGKTVVEVPELLWDWLQLSSSCPSIAKCYRENADKFLALPEYVFDEVRPDYYVESILTLSGNLIMFAQSIRQQVAGYFEDLQYAQRLKFKEFGPIPNKFRLIPLQVSPSSPIYYILDMKYLDPNLIHQEFLHKDTSFHCPGGGRCSCIVQAIIDSILTLLPRGTREKLDAHFRRNFLSQYAVDINALSSKQVLEKQRQQEKKALTKKTAQNAPTKILSNNNSGYQKNSTSSLDEDESFNTESDNDDTNSTSQDSQIIKKCSKTAENRDEEKGSLKNMFSSMNSLFERCYGVGNIRCNTSPFKCPGSRYTCIEEKSPSAYDLLPKTFRIKSNELKIFIETSDKTKYGEVPFALHCLEYLSITMVLLASRVLNYPIHLCHLVIQDSATIAFNRGGNIFFNIIAAESFLLNGVSLPLRWLDFWFVTFCHEITHNSCRNHDERFATEMGYLVQSKLEIFRLFCSNNSISSQTTWDQIMKLL